MHHEVGFSRRIPLQLLSLHGGDRKKGRLWAFLGRMGVGSRHSHGL